ncbi:MAG: hypothetical protein ACM3SP_12560 [Chloroflexota bacterium]
MARSLLAYCVEHPDAKDTVEGIQRWWFTTGQTSWGVDEVRNALESLTARKWLTRRTVRQAEEIYGVNKEKLDEIKSFLRFLKVDPK